MAVSIVAVSAAMWQFSLSVAGDGKVVAGDGNSVCLVVVLVVILVAIVIILYLVWPYLVSVPVMFLPFACFLYFFYRLLLF